MAIITRRNLDGTMSYQVKVKDPTGHWYPTPSFRDLAEAKAHEADLFKAKKKNKGSITSDAKSTTVNEYWEVWSVENRNKVSDGWKISQDQMYRDYVRPIIGDLTMIKVGIPEVGRIFTAMIKIGRSAQTRQNVYTMIRKMFADAVEYYGMLDKSPVQPKFHREKVPETERDFLQPADIWKLLNFTRDNYLGPAIWLPALSGLRSEAVIALSWSCVLWDTDQIQIRRAWKQKVGKIEDYPKGKSWEYVPMPPALRDYLWSLWEKSDRDPAGFVCRSTSGGMLPYETYLRATKRLCKKAGVPVVTPHELRHSCSELYVRVGCSQEDIRRLLNHKSVSTTKRYMHRTDERLADKAKLVGQPGALTVIDGGSFPKCFPNGKKQTSASPVKEEADAC